MDKVFLVVSSSKDEEPSGLDQIDATGMWAMIINQPNKSDRDHHNSQKSAYVRKLLDEANRQLLFEIQQKKEFVPPNRDFLIRIEFCLYWKIAAQECWAVFHGDLSESEKAVQEVFFVIMIKRIIIPMHLHLWNRSGQGLGSSPTGRKSGVLWREQVWKAVCKKRYMKFKVESSKRIHFLLELQN